MLRNLFPFLTGLLLAAGLSQFPEFTQQYTQRLAGAYFEIRDVADRFRADAAANGQTVATALDIYQASDDAFLRDRGASMDVVLSREAFLARHYQRLTDSRGFGALYEFLRERDNDIARAALGLYQPAVPLTFTGLAHAALGFLLGFALVRLGGVSRSPKNRPVRVGRQIDISNPR